MPEALRDPDVAADDGRRLSTSASGWCGPCPATTPWPGEFWTARSKEAIAPMDRDVQIVSDVNVPVRGLLVVVIFFAIGIGPVNVWLLSRRQKRMWLWWNVPAVSLATCLAVFAYSLFSEGISGRGRIGLDHVAGREHAPRHDAGIYLVLLPVDAVRRIALLVRHRGGAAPLE